MEKSHMGKYGSIGELYWKNIGELYWKNTG
jgi:hypothetical protein